MTDRRDKGAGETSGGGWLAHPKWGGIGVIVGVVALAGTALGLAVTWDSGSHPAVSPTSSVAQSRPKSLLEQIAADDIWASPPHTFRSAAAPLPDMVTEGSGSYTGNMAPVEEGDVVAVTPAELVSRAYDYDGELVYLVGRAVGDRTVDDRFGMTDEIQLAPDHGVDAYLGTAGTVIVQPGTVIWVLGRIAAVGETKLGSGGTRRSAYFVTFYGGGPGDIGIDFDNGEASDKPGSAAIRQAMARCCRAKP